MSGFAGVVCALGGSPDSRLLERMAARQTFRGPHASYTWIQREAGFCAALLRTGPAPQAEAQPVSIDDRTWLLGDVRLDGREELRRRLEERGERIAADASDEEMILRAWRQWGEDCLPELLGDYSFVIWDAEARRLWCVRDWLGSRPFFYAQAGENFYFSNTLEVLRQATEISSELDRHFIGDFLLEGWCSDLERTVYRDIRRLVPGHVLEYSNGQTRSRQFIALPIDEPLWLKRSEEYEERYLEMLEQAVRDRLPRQSAGFAMSGGLDSTSVAATAVKIARESGSGCALKAFTVSYRPLFDDPEEEFAIRAAKHFGMPIDVLHAASFLPFAGIAEGQFRTPEPCNEVFFATQAEYYRRIAAHSCVVLSGDGGDDVLTTGQSWPYFRYLFGRKRWGTIFRTFGGYFLEHGRLPPVGSGIRAKITRLRGRAEELSDYPPWLKPTFEREMRLRERWRELQRRPKQRHPLHHRGYEGLSNGFWAVILELEDAGWTGVTVQRRTPLFDFRLLRFLLRIPPVPECVDKRLVRRAMKDLLPEEIRARPKTSLVQDPLQLYVEKGTWQWKPLPGTVEAIGNFVDVDQLNATLAQNRGCNAWRDLQPVGLMFWLRG
jgi:asparagine synthase (glutamine-hydrolysing)